MIERQRKSHRSVAGFTQDFIEVGALRYCLWIGVTCLLLVGQLSRAESALDFRGYVFAEPQLFLESANSNQQRQLNFLVGVSLEFEKAVSNNDFLYAKLLARVDAVDDSRTLVDISELYWEKQLGMVKAIVGINKVFWGVAESAHIVDIINQDDLVEDLDREQKLGQAMVNLSADLPYGNLSLFVLPRFVEKTFPSLSGRPRVSTPIGRPVYESSAKENHIDLALRWTQVVGDFDIGVSHFVGTGRDPILIPRETPESQLILDPQYGQISQTGLDLQATLDAWLWKLELINVNPSRRASYQAGVGGFEGSLYSVGSTKWDLGFLAEYQFDTRGIEGGVFGQNDLAAGVRLSFNDVAGSQVLALLSHDFDTGSKVITLEASKRLSNNTELSLNARFFSVTERNSPEFQFKMDDNIKLEFRMYF